MLDLDDWERLANTATPGPWEAGTAMCCPDMGWVDGPKGKGRVCPVHEAPKRTHTLDANDAEFIAMARTAVPALIAEVRRLQSAAECDACGGHEHGKDAYEAGARSRDAEVAELRAELIATEDAEDRQRTRAKNAEAELLMWRARAHEVDETVVAAIDRAEKAEAEVERLRRIMQVCAAGEEWFDWKRRYLTLRDIVMPIEKRTASVADVNEEAGWIRDERDHYMARAYAAEDMFTRVHDKMAAQIRALKYDKHLLRVRLETSRRQLGRIGVRLHRTREDRKKLNAGLDAALDKLADKASALDSAHHETNAYADALLDANDQADDAKASADKWKRAAKAFWQRTAAPNNPPRHSVQLMVHGEVINFTGTSDLDATMRALVKTHEAATEWSKRWKRAAKWWRAKTNDALAMCDDALAERDDAMDMFDVNTTARLESSLRADRLQWRLDRTIEVLREVQWSGRISSHPYPKCPMCRNFDSQGHAGGCRVAEACRDD
jgi:hypothetical protein